MVLDGEGKGYITAENVQWLYLALGLDTCESSEGLRISVGELLQLMNHCAPYVTLRDFKNYFLTHGFNLPEEIVRIHSRLTQICQIIETLKSKVLKSGLDNPMSLCLNFATATLKLPSLWE